MRNLLLFSMFFLSAQQTFAGKGAFIRINNLSASTLTYNTSNVGCMDPCDVKGTLAPKSARGKVYVEEKKFCWGDSKFKLNFSNAKGSAQVQLSVQSSIYYKSNLTENGIYLNCTILEKHDLFGSGDQYLIDITISDMAIEGRNWMSHLDDRTKLTEMAIPGTHDSGANDASMLPKIQTQYLSILEQLEAGIRYFDMRGYSDGKLSKAGINANWFGGNFDGECDIQVCHDAFRMPYTFSLLMADVTTFLAKNPGETVLIQVKEDEGDKKMLSRFKCLIDKTVYKDSYVKNPTINLTLGQCRRKIVFTSRISGDFGFNLDFTNNAIFKNGSFWIQDKYNTDTKALESVATDKFLISKSFHEQYASGNYKGEFNINFLSVANFLSYTPLQNSVEINYRFQKFLNERASKFNSIVLMDGVERETPLVKSIYYTNYLN